MSNINPKCDCGNGKDLCENCMDMYNYIYFGCS